MFSIEWFAPYIIGLIRWLNPESTCANTVEVVCLIEFTRHRNTPASLIMYLPGSNINFKFLP